jgi:hypothetical protein
MTEVEESENLAIVCMDSTIFERGAMLPEEKSEKRLVIQDENIGKPPKNGTVAYGRGFALLNRP